MTTLRQKDIFCESCGYEGTPHDDGQYVCRNCGSCAILLSDKPVEYITGADVGDLLARWLTEVNAMARKIEPGSHQYQAILKVGPAIAKILSDMYERFSDNISPRNTNIDNNGDD